MSEYEVIIVQERYDVDPDLLSYLSSIGHRFSIVRPHLYDLINGVALRSYCAIARNQAVELAEREWVVFLSDGSDPDTDWLSDLERDLDDAEANCAAASVAANSDPEASRVGDVAYRRDVLQAVGGFLEDQDSEGCEDFVAQLELVANGYKIVQGSRRSNGGH
ncbi:MAG: glycosyltransferase family A protein [Acidimicrobiales bacterium]